MQKALRWQSLLWVCLTTTASVSAAEAVTLKSFGECRVLDLSLDPIHYPLPTNLTVKPISPWWHLKLVLGVDPAKPIACIAMEDTGSWVDVSLFSGDCKNGRNVNFGHLKRPFNNETWTTLGLKVLDNAVVVQAPQGESVILTGHGFSLRQKGLQVKVTEAWGVEAAVGCAVGCPVHHHASAGAGIKKRVKEWNQDSLHFYFLPGESFSGLHYDVKCTTQQKKVFRREVEIKLGENGAAREWHRVELIQTQNNARVSLNGKLLEAIQLPESCISSMHVIWTVGDGYFDFHCIPERASAAEERESSTQENEQDSLMHPGVSAGITLAVMFVIFGVILAYVKKKNTSQRDPPGKDGDRSQRGERRKQGDEEKTISKCVITQPHSPVQNDKENSRCHSLMTEEKELEADEENGLKRPPLIQRLSTTRVKEWLEYEEQKRIIEPLLYRWQSRKAMKQKKINERIFFSDQSLTLYSQKTAQVPIVHYNKYNNIHNTVH